MRVGVADGAILFHQCVLLGGGHQPGGWRGLAVTIGCELNAAVNTRKAEVLRVDGMLFSYWEEPPQIYHESGGLDSVGLFQCAVTEANEKTIPLMFAS